jgi:hypothetical protein
MGNGPQLFYYRDQSGRSVGPLPLSEIFRFVEAGLLPADVRVREENDIEWSSLNGRLGPEGIPGSTRSSDSSTRPSTITGLPDCGTPTFGQKKESRKILGESVEGWLVCAGFLIAATVFYMILMQPLVMLMEWLYDKFWRIEIDLF